jgi:DNA-binding XRE family transcriptional regulator
MGVLEIIAEQRIGMAVLKKHRRLRASLKQAEELTARPKISDDEKDRIAAIIDLCFEYQREPDPDEKTNILRTLEEISANTPLELPAQSIEEWDAELKVGDTAYAKADRSRRRRIEGFLKKYFLLRANAGLKTQAAIAKASGLKRSYIAVIETGEHFPQQKTLQKLAKAFRVEVTDLLS